MPELPDVEIYVEALSRRLLGSALKSARIRGPFLLRSVKPPVQAACGKRVLEIRRVGKRIAIGFEDELWFVLHLMIAGRLHWKDVEPKALGKNILAAFAFESGVLTLTEAGSQRRASLYVLQGPDAPSVLNAGGIDVFSVNFDAFWAVLRSENHTLKRSLTDPRLFSGIGNAYSDEILHRAGLSPVALTERLDRDQASRLHQAAKDVLREWTERLRRETGDRFPEKVTAFRQGMAAHGRFGEPCPRCGTKIQRIRYASNETNYCPECQTGGRLLADRSLSRLLHDDWPSSLDELEALKKR